MVSVLCILIDWASWPVFLFTWFWRQKRVRNSLLAALLGSLIASRLFGGEAVWRIWAMVLQLAFGFGFMAVQFIGLFWFLSRTQEILVLPGDKGSVSFEEDYFGNEELVSAIREWTHLATRAGRDKIKKVGAEPISGLLMVGPPGSGKTLLAKCLASSSDAAFLGLDGSSFSSMFFGIGPQPCDTPVLTPNGWKEIGNLIVGDVVFSRSGKPTTVTDIEYHGRQSVYKVILADGRETRATANHLWRVIPYHGRNRSSYLYGRETIKRTDQLKTKYMPDAIPLASSIDMPNRDLPIAPYTLGALLGDGCMVQNASISISVHEKDSEILDRVESEVGFGKRCNRRGKYICLYLTNGFRGPRGNEVINSLRALGLYGAKHDDKRIPEIYLRSSIDDRANLLRGLMDTDGSVSQQNRISFTTTSSGLADDIVELIRSLGGRADIHVYKRPLRKPEYRVHIGVPGDFCPFYLGRKANRVRARTKHYVDCLVVKDVVPAGESDVCCIEVADDDHLYVTEDYIVTHNTLKVIGMFRKARSLAKQYNGCYLFIDEIDGIGARGGVMGDPRTGPVQGGMAGGIFGGGAGLGVLPRLLVELDGVKNVPRRDMIQNKMRAWFGIPPIDQGVVMVIGASNRPDTIDSAIKRPGRLDKQVIVDLPDARSRKAIVKGYLGKVSHDDTVDVDALVANTQGVSPAALSSAIQRSAVRYMLKDKRDLISMSDIEQALEEDLMGIRNPIGDFDPQQERQVAYHEAGHAIMAYYMRPKRRVTRVSIVRRGSGILGYMRDVSEQEVFAMPLSDIAANIMVALAGHYATELMMGERWTGASGDFRHVQAYMYALAQHGEFGEIPFKMDDPFSSQSIKDGADDYLERVIGATREFVKDHRREIEMIARELIGKKELSSGEFLALMKGESDGEQV